MRQMGATGFRLVELHALAGISDIIESVIAVCLKRGRSRNKGINKRNVRDIFSVPDKRQY